MKIDVYRNFSNLAAARATIVQRLEYQNAMAQIPEHWRVGSSGVVQVGKEMRNGDCSWVDIPFLSVELLRRYRNQLTLDPDIPF